MKCKAACAGLSDDLINDLNGLRPTILERVVGPILHRPQISAAGFYVQKTDLAESQTHAPFCEVRLSGVSLTDDRSVSDLRRARIELEKIYRQTIYHHLKIGEEVTLFVILMVDGSPKPGMSSLLEGEEVTIRGGC